MTGWNNLFEILNLTSNLFCRYIDFDLTERMKEYNADLVVLEGMGRSIHTNFLATFSCDTLKAAVLKNQWLATKLGGGMFNVVFKYERACKVTLSTSDSR